MTSSETSVPAPIAGLQTVYPQASTNGNTETHLSKRSGPNAPGVAFVTGGARGLGNAIAVSYAREGARAVVIVDIGDENTCEAGKRAVERYGTEVRNVCGFFCRVRGFGLGRDE